MSTDLKQTARRLETLVPVELIYELQKLSTDELMRLHEYSSARVRDSIKHEIRSGE